MNETRGCSEMRSTTLCINLDFLFKLTERDIDTNVVEIDELKLFVDIHYGQKIVTYVSKPGEKTIKLRQDSTLPYLV